MSVSIWEGQKAQELIDAISGNQKVDKIQGQIFAGKSLVVGDDGIVGVGDVGLSENVKLALINALNHVAWVDDSGSSYVQALQNAMYADSTESWMYIWNYLIGLPENHGMNIVDGATGYTINATAEGIEIATTNTTESIIRYSYPFTPITRNKIVIETMFMVKNWGSYNVYPYINGVRVSCGFSPLNNDYLPGAQLTFNRSGVSYYSPGLPENESGEHLYMLDTSPIELNTIYKVRCEQYNTSVTGAKSSETDVFVNERFLGRIVNKGENIGSSQFIVKRGCTATFKSFKFRQD